jgi:RNA polymerase sigma-70 factor (family 1)
MAIKPLLEERELLAKIAAGDERAFKELFDGYYNHLGEYVFKLTESIPTAQEIVQDTFVKVWLNREKLTDIKSFSNYIFILCRNHTYNTLRKTAADRTFLKALDQHLTEESKDNEQHSKFERYRLLIDAAVEKLPPQAQKVYLMSRDERLKHEEIGLALNISSETVKKHIQYAKKHILEDVRSHLDLAVVMVLATALILS